MIISSLNKKPWKPALNFLFVVQNGRPAVEQALKRDLASFRITSENQERSKHHVEVQ